MTTGANYDTGTLSLGYESISDMDFPITVIDNVCIQATITKNQVLKIGSNVNYLIVFLIFTTDSPALRLLPPTGCTINGQSSFDMIYNQETVTLARNIGGSDYSIIINGSAASIATIGTSTNNAIVRVGGTPGTVANSTVTVSDAGTITTFNNITCLDVQNNGLYFYSTVNGMSLGSSFPVTLLKRSTNVGINTTPSQANSGAYFGYGAISPSYTGIIFSTVVIGSQAAPSLTDSNNSSGMLIGYNAWKSATSTTANVVIGTNNYSSAGATTTACFIGKDLFTTATSAVQSLIIGRANNSPNLSTAVIISSNCAPNWLTSSSDGIIVIGHNSVTDGTSTMSGLGVYGSGCNVSLSNSVIVGYGINAKGPSTVDVNAVGSTASRAATSLTGTAINVAGYASSPNITGSNIITVGSGTNGLGLTDVCAIGYQAANASTATTCAVLGFQAGQTGNITSSAAIGYRALNAGAQSSVFIGSQAGLAVTGTTNNGAGYNVGATLTTGTGNILLGSGADVSAAARSNSIAIGKGAVTQTDNGIALGSAGTALTTQTTIGAAGGASALPATPQTYLFVRLNGTLLRTPIYN